MRIGYITNIFVVVALPLASAFLVIHAEEQRVAKIDTACGGVIFNNGVSANGVPACTSYHGISGNSTMNVDPRLADQHTRYAEKQFEDSKAKIDCSHLAISLYASVLSNQDMKDIGVYLGKRPAQKSGSAESKNTIELDQKLYRGRDAKRGIATHAGCHGPTDVGIPAQYPRIAGQFSEYMEAQLMAFQNGARENNVQVHDLTGRMTAQRIKAVTNYVAGLR